MLYSSKASAKLIDRHMLFLYLCERARNEPKEKQEPVLVELVEKEIQPTPRRRTHSFAFPWMFVLVASLFILVMGPLVWLFVASATYTYPTSSITSSKPAPTPVPAKIVCSVSKATSAKTSVSSTAVTMVPLASFVAFDGGDPIKDAIQGCASGIPANLGTDSGQTAGNGGSYSTGTTLVCDSQITVILTVTRGDLAVEDPYGYWYALGREWPSADPGDFVLWNPPINDVTGLSTGNNANLYIVHGKLTINVPGLVVFSASGTSDQSSRILQAVYSQFSSYHGILKNITNPADGPTVLQTLGLQAPFDGENEW